MGCLWLLVPKHSIEGDSCLGNLIQQLFITGFAWAVAFREGKSRFGSTEPTPRWWRGFRDRRRELTLKKTKFVDHSCVENASLDVIQDYFPDTSILEDNGLTKD